MLRETAQRYDELSARGRRLSSVLAIALGLVLFLVTLVLNIIALHVVPRYREQYE